MYLGVDEIESALFDGNDGAVYFDQRWSSYRRIGYLPRCMKTQLVTRRHFNCKKKKNNTLFVFLSQDSIDNIYVTPETR